MILCQCRRRLGPLSHARLLKLEAARTTKSDAFKGFGVILSTTTGAARDYRQAQLKGLGSICLGT